MIGEKSLFTNISKTDDKDDLWSSRIGKSLKKFLSENGRVNQKSIENFRRVQVFISELPSYQGHFLINWISGSRRGQRQYAKNRLDKMFEHGDLDLMKKYPINRIGNPCYFDIKGYQFNERWTRHIRYLNLASKYLRESLRSGNATVLDIGGGYGIFQGLLKAEFGEVRSALVEFPEQLLLAYYYFAMNYPQAKINTLEEANEAKVIDKNFVSKYDFLLIPIECYSKIQKNTFDIVCNFNSLGEMSENG